MPDPLPSPVDCEDKSVGTPKRFFHIFHPGAGFGVNGPRHGKILIGLDGSVPERQVAEMAETGEAPVVPTEIFADGPRVRTY